MTARVPWLALCLLLGAAGTALLGPWLRLFPGLLPDCTFKAVTGIPCATCGITRCLLALSEGNWLEAFNWHPVAGLLICLSPAAAAWDLRRAWRCQPYPPLPDHWIPRMLAGGLFLGTWALQILRGR